MRLSNALKEKKMDLRLRDKNIAEGKISKEELDQFVTSLPDDTASMTFVDDVAKAQLAESAQEPDIIE